MANFRKIRQYLSFDVVTAFMHATIFSHMSHCLTCWGQAGETVIKPLKSLYKQTLQILDKKPNHFHFCRIIEKHNFLTFDNFRLYSNLCMVHKILNGLAPYVILLIFIVKPLWDLPDYHLWVTVWFPFVVPLLNYHLLQWEPLIRVMPYQRT